MRRPDSSASTVATEALQRWARIWIYQAEATFLDMDEDGRRQARQQLSKPLWEEFEVWLKLQRAQVLDGSKIAEAIDYSINAWKALTLHLDEGAVAIDNNLIERQIKPWKLGVKNWLFVGSELAGQRAAVVMSLVQSAKLNGLDPWVYLRDVLARIHLQALEILPRKPFAHDVGVQAVADGYGSYRGIGLPALIKDLRIELGAVNATIGAIGIHRCPPI